MKEPSKLFRKSLGEWANATEAKLDGLARQVCQSMAELALDKTPVVDGFLRGSWQPAIGTMALAENAAADPSGAGVQAKIAATIVDIKTGDTFYMMNNAAYAMRIEFGFVGQDSLGRTYNQAGQFFVTDTVKSFDLIVAKEAAELGLKK